LHLSRHVGNVLSSGQLADEFTSSDVWKLLPADIKSQVKPNRITDLFKKGKLRARVEDMKKRKVREKVYRVR